jgi:hypothetical protein
MGAPGLNSKIAVPPVTPAVKAGVVIWTAGAFFGTCRSMAPLPKFSSRVPSLKLKIVFAPRRVMVASVKVSSARDSMPVRTAVPCCTSSLTAAGLGAAWPESNLTSLMI